jgi:DNA-binding GntR family transcriptional regulator
MLVYWLPWLEWWITDSGLRVYRAKIDRERMREQCEEHLLLIDLVRKNERVEASHFLRQHLDGARQRKAGAALGARGITPAAKAG